MSIKQMLGKLLYYSIGIHMPQSFSSVSLGSKKVRAFCGKLMLDNCGKNVNIERGAKIDKHVSLGNNSGIGINAFIESNVTIGANVMMGQDCMIFTRNHAFDDSSIPMMQQGFSDYKPVNIGDDVWIGARVIILPGVSIADGCIIGAGAIVTKSTEPYGKYAGNPAKKIGSRVENT